MRDLAGADLRSTTPTPSAARNTMTALNRDVILLAQKNTLAEADAAGRQP